MVAAFLMLMVGLTTDLIGLALFVAVLAIQNGRKTRGTYTRYKNLPGYQDEIKSNSSRYRKGLFHQRGSLNDLPAC